MKNFRL